MPRYKQILDVIVDDIKEHGRYDRVFFDHNDDGLTIPYRGYCYLRNSSLYEIPREMIGTTGKFDVGQIVGKKGAYQKKQADVTGISGDRVILIVEEEKNPKNVKHDLEAISKCNFMIDKNNKVYPLNKTVLFVVVQDLEEETEYLENEGTVGLVIICDKESFKHEYNRTMQIDMDWPEAKEQIEKKIQVGTDVNSERSTLRKIRTTNYACYSSRYGYNGEKGFLVQIGKKNNLRIPWSMLKNCFIALKSLEGYNGSYFRKKYPLQAKDHRCHVHVVGVIFEKSGIAYKKGNAYFINE